MKHGSHDHVYIRVAIITLSLLRVSSLAHEAVYFIKCASYFSTVLQIS
jgi:hypothetical protein